QQWFITRFQRPLYPPVTVLLLHADPGAPHRAFARHFCHPQQFRVYSIAANGMDVLHRANAPLAPITESCPAHPVSVALGLVHCKGHSSTQSSNRPLVLRNSTNKGIRPKLLTAAFGYPLHLGFFSKGVHPRHRLRRLNPHSRTLTLWVNLNQGFLVAHPEQYRLLLCLIQRATFSRFTTITPEVVR